MRWLCRFFKHKWIDALDEELQVCNRCDKLRKKLRLLPLGAYPCPYPDCNKKWSLAPPLTGSGRSGKTAWIVEYYCKCSNCKQWLRWDRKDRSAPWGNPVASMPHESGGTYWYGYSN